MADADIAGELSGLLAPERVLRGIVAETYAVDGCLPSITVRPETVLEVASVVRFAGEHGLAVIPWGSGTLIDLGNRPSRFDVALDLTRLNEISDYSPEDLVATVQAGVSIHSLNAVLARQGQFLALDPPRADVATVGGALSAGIAGPLKQRYGAARDLVIGLTCVLAGGEIVHSGGRVVKNVAGYDLNKLYLGALGSAGVIVEASFKLHPIPSSRAALAAVFPSCATAHAAALTLINSHFGPEAVEIGDPAAAKEVAPSLDATGWLLAVQMGGLAAAVDRQRTEMAAIIRSSGAISISVPEAEERDLVFRRLRDYGREPDRQAALILRCTVLPSEVAVAVGRLDALVSALPAAVLASPGAGLLKLVWATPAAADAARVRAVRAEVESMGGNVTIERCPAPMKAELEVWGIAGADLGLMHAVKAAYDPNGTLSPGRFVDRL